MIDKVVLRVKAGTKHSEFFRTVLHTGGREVWRKAPGYAQSGDFSALGLPVIVFENCQMTKQPNHKIEILETGKKSFQQIVEIAGKVFEGDPETWGIIRTDLCADVPDVKVQWFKQHVYVAYKRTIRDLAVIPPEVGVQTVRSSRSQTLYFGKRPNLIRIYDKIGEETVRYKKYCRRLERKEMLQNGRFSVAEYESTALDIPTFEEWSEGHNLDQVLTRVERQVVGDDLSSLHVDNLNSLRSVQHARPFGQIKFFPPGAEDLSRERWGPRDYAIGEMIRRDIIDWGMDQAMEMLRCELKSNLPRWKNKYAPFIRAAVNDYKEMPLTAMQLQAEFERSTRLQMAA